MEFKKILKNHYLAILLAVFVSLVVAFPQIYFRFEHRNDGVYQGIELLPDSPWSPRVREIQDGNGFGSIYYQDGKNDPYLFQPLGSMVVAYLGKLFFLDINNTFLLSRLFLSFLTFLLIYSFIFLLSRDKLSALCGVLVTLLANSLLNRSGLLQMINGTSPGRFLELSTPVNPGMILVPFFGFLISFWLFYKNNNWFLGVMSAIILGLNFYNYFYSWTYLYAFGGFLVLLLIIQKKWQEVIRITGVFLGALVVAIPYALNLYQASRYSNYEDVGLRLGIIASHRPLFVGLMSVAALIVFLYGFSKSDREKYYFGLALLLAPLATMNQQILTGKILQVGHYHWYFHKPIAIIFILLVIFYLLSRWGLDFYKKAIAIFILVLSLFACVFIQIVSYSFDRDYGYQATIEKQKYGLALKWLSGQAKKEAVVMSNEEISHLTVIYTPLNVFYHRIAFASLSASRERLFEILFTFYRLRNIGAEDVKKVFFAERGYLSWNIYGIHYREFLGSYEAIPDDKIEEMITLYQKTLQTPKSIWLHEIFEKYKVDYIVWDKKADPLWSLDQYPYLKKEAQFGDLTIYKFRP